ncbi:MAG TPA: carbamoyltransferase [Verrucomicrobiae bacterium]|jgi:carbamoyltransferase|nr:carbamoyltransferase [Verrucomicrobiae bacterium]
MTSILGISAFYHDSAAALVVDGRIVAAAQEERFTRRKHDPDFPKHAAEYCLREAGLELGELDYVVFYEKPLLKFDRLLETYFAFAPAGFASFREAMPLWLRDKLYLRRKLRAELKNAKRARFIFTEHHESHAASAFFPSPFEDAAILTVDGVGEWTTATLGVGEGNRLRLLRELKFPHSLGLLYSAFTYYCGFKVNSGEYKLMGLAPYGQPRFADAIRKHLLDLRPDGSFRMNMDYFNYCQGLTMTNERFHGLFGGPPRAPESQLEQRHMDLAASIQVVSEEIFIAMARELHRLTGKKNLVLAGGVALNCVANGRLLREGPFSDFWIQPAAGDAGGALGAALFVWHQLLEKPRRPASVDSQSGSFLGPRFSDDEVDQALQTRSLPGRRFDDEEALLKQIVEALEDGKVVGWFHGRMEFGPRALGARSILGDARNPAMQAVMNLKIKYRESFRPFAPCILRERAADYFALPRHIESPYMLLVAPLLERHRTPLSDAQRGTMTNDPDLRQRVNVARSTVPAITHVDYSARIQTVDEERHGRFYRLLKMFEERTGCPMLVNTSFNVRGEPIVCTPDDAIRCFLATDMDLLVLENFIADKQQVTRLPSAAEKAGHLAAFQPD